MAQPTVQFKVSSLPPEPAPAVPSSPFHLSPEQVQFYDDHGYLLLRGWIRGPLLEAVQRAAERWIADGQALEPAHAGDDFNFAPRPDGPALFRVNYLHARGQEASLALLGSPEVLGVAESLCGPSFVPTYESLVFKQRGDGEQIPWHQDAVHPRRWRIFNFDLYLDASRAGGGALRVVPGTHRQLLDPCDIRDEYGWDAPGVVQVEMEPGDVLLHDVMVLHGSEPTPGGELRRTVYLEFRAAQQIMHEGPWDAEWVQRRLRLMPLALRAHARAFPHLPPFTWTPSAQWRPQDRQDDATELKVAHLVHTPGAWCSAGSVPLKDDADVLSAD
ncbi:phytanoyl-CoA dioxygenase family protein [Deinococcus sp.]|uniref:phytanoyl-CoA dioxygenase family protein n=1 Tax=Deinococcus sp. TaxID=47478 RepID=UPI0028699F1D|nr:phytanoyl-CoA dioxygenase family protein [Deinococcus sp.]